jgi:gliding motility-associated-like protein
MPTASPTQTTTYTLTVNENNCSATSTVTVNISPTFSVGSQQDETLDYGQTLPITIDVIPNIGTTLPSNLTYIWSPIAGVSNPSSNDVVLSPTETTIYTFTATDANGCEVSISFTVTADNAVSYGIPNAFTPNGKNTHFKPIIEGPIIIKEFLIFNRWGQVMYNEPDGTGWDGNANGMEQPQDTYIYIGQLEMPDGEVIRVKGELLLVR